MNGFELQSAYNGKMGIAIAQAFHPDLILCDWMMDDMDGFEVLKTIRSNTSLSTIPFVFLTALTDRESIRLGMDAGADDYVAKPFTIAELLETVNVWVDYKHSLVKR
jgi:DNA-binding response OmpR family regulator